MSLLKTTKAFLDAKKRPTRAEVLRTREARLRQTLLDAYDHSVFYRTRWEEAGITRAELADLPLHRLPIVTKQEVMDAFDKVVTQPFVTKGAVEACIAADPEGKQKFQHRYIILNTSGSSGLIGMFLFTEDFWARLMGVVAGRLLPFSPLALLQKKARIAFVGETSGHHAGVSMIRNTPSFLQKMNIDVAAPKEEMLRVLNDFQPNVLTGYASGLAVVAELAHEGKLAFAPKAIISSGEPLSAIREQAIVSAFGIRPIDFYGATECLGMGASLSEGGVLDLFDDLVVVEAVDEEGSPVAPGEMGRVVITVLGNSIEPLIRYALDDEISLYPDDGVHPFTRAGKVSGRKLERIPLILPDGRTANFHPMDFVGLFAPGMKQYQIEQKAPLEFIFRVVAEENHGELKRALEIVIEKLLKQKMLTPNDVSFLIEFVAHISPNAKTGKTPLVLPLKKS